MKDLFYWLTWSQKATKWINATFRFFVLISSVELVQITSFETFFGGWIFFVPNESNSNRLLGLSWKLVLKLLSVVCSMARLEQFQCQGNLLWNTASCQLLLYEWKSLNCTESVSHMPIFAEKIVCRHFQNPKPRFRILDSPLQTVK